MSIKGIKQEPLAVTPYNEKGKPPPIDAYMVIDNGKPKLFLRGYSQDGKTEQISLVRNKDAVRYSRRCLSWINSECCMTILLHQLWEELLPWERTQWPWSKHVKFRPSWLFHKGCLSLRSCQTAILSHVGTLNSAYRGLSTCQSAFIGAIALLFLSSSFIWNPWASLGRILPHSGFATKTIFQGAPLPAEHSKN